MAGEFLNRYFTTSFTGFGGAGGQWPKKSNPPDSICLTGCEKISLPGKYAGDEGIMDWRLEIRYLELGVCTRLSQPDFPLNLVFPGIFPKPDRDLG